MGIKFTILCDGEYKHYMLASLVLVNVEEFNVRAHK